MNAIYVDSLALFKVLNEIMGAAASSIRHSEPTDAELSQLGPPTTSKQGNKCFSCIPLDTDAKKKYGVLRMEISGMGLHILRPDTEDCISFHPWGSLHSWSCASSKPNDPVKNKFIYRYWDDLSKTVKQTSVYLLLVEAVLEEIQTIIDDILKGRRNQAMDDITFCHMMDDIRGSIINGSAAAFSPSSILASTAPTFLWADQGRILLESLSDSFERVEAAVQLHQRLIDQNRFTWMIDALDCQADRDNVWHRVTQIRRRVSVIGGSLSQKGNSGVGGEMH